MSNPGSAAHAAGTRARTASVTVAFNPDPERLVAQIVALAGQVDDVIIVDNGSKIPVAALAAQPALANARVVARETNEGIARGFNIGIDEARRRGAAYVLLLDHDSVPERGMVDALLDGAARVPASEAGRAAAFGPRIRDPRDRKEYPFVQLGWLRNRHLRCATDIGLVPCDFLISSGVLLRLASLEAIGGYDEALFIDNVDLEWCFRARSLGFGLYGVCSAVLDHRLGDERRTVFKGLELVVHSPERAYYMTRNRVLLYQRGYMPLKWKVKDVARALAKFLATMMWIAPRVEYARMTWRGLRDALARRGGRVNEASRISRPDLPAG